MHPIIGGLATQTIMMLMWLSKPSVCISSRVHMTNDNVFVVRKCAKLLVENKFLQSHKIENEGIKSSNKKNVKNS